MCLNWIFLILDWIQVVVLVGIPEIPVCPISGDVSCVWLVREVSARFLTSDTPAVLFVNSRNL